MVDLSVHPAEVVELGIGGVKADLESFDLAEPAVTAGLADALAEVLDDLDEAARWHGSICRTGQRMQASLNFELKSLCSAVQVAGAIIGAGNSGGDRRHDGVPHGGDRNGAEKSEGSSSAGRVRAPASGSGHLC
ncbi:MULTISPECIES: hypothetical protein [unclassified Streptomyces]|uniref:hypothetical protein n=1 Tax=unclassified Streptomyces TaxID=2593676 RepID=UPI0037FECFC3